MINEEQITDENFWGELPFDVGGDPWDAVAQAKRVPGIESARHKFGTILTYKYLSILYDWAVEGAYPYHHGKTIQKVEEKAKFLLENRNILRHLSPISEKPEIVYRGIQISDKTEGNLITAIRNNAPIFYSTLKPATSWTDSFKAGKLYCREGYLIICPFDLVIKHADLYIWPFTGELAKFGFNVTRNREWGFWIKKQFKVPKVEICSQRPIDPGFF